MYKGTTWKFKTLDGTDVSAGEEVLVERFKNNVAHIKKIA
jgi:membrane protein implicated in regulation of membrane protease activity